MFSSRLFRGTLFCLLVAAWSGVGAAQSLVLDLPRQSQRAQISQRVGITDITINYHRPLVNKRKVWDGLVPYGQVWRAGANENTTISFSDPVTIEGKALDKGTYGLFMIPAADHWTIIFSKNSTAWGAFTYNQAEDALRVTVKPAAAEMHNAVTFDFDDVQPNSAIVTMAWEKVAVPFKVGVDVHEIVEASVKKQIRGLGQYTWEGWDEAANYLEDNKLNPEEALKWADQSIQVEERFENLMTKARVLDTLNRQAEATAVRAKALETGSALQVHIYGRQLQRQGKQDEAFAVFRGNIKKYPDNWLSHSEVARLACAKGDFDTAVKEMKIAVGGADPQNKPGFEALVKRLEAKEDINK